MQKVLITELENVFKSLYDIPRHFEGLNKTLSTAVRLILVCGFTKKVVIYIRFGNYTIYLVAELIY